MQAPNAKKSSRLRIRKDGHRVCGLAGSVGQEELAPPSPEGRVPCNVASLLWSVMRFQTFQLDNNRYPVVVMISVRVRRAVVLSSVRK